MAWEVSGQFLPSSSFPRPVVEIRVVVGNLVSSPASRSGLRSGGEGMDTGINVAGAVDDSEA